MTIKTQYILLISLFILFQVKTNAQTSKLEQYKNKIQQHTKEDTTKVKLLNDLIYEIYNEDVKQADSLIDLSNVLANKLNYRDENPRINYIKGKVKKQVHQHKRAIQYYSKALNVYTKQVNNDSLALCYYDIAVVSYYIHDYNKAIRHFEKALDYYKLLQNKDKIASSYNSLALTYSETGDSEKTLDYYKKALTIFKETKNQNSIVNCYNNIGVAHDNMGNYPLAMENYSKALNMAKKINNKSIVFKALNNIGLIHKHTGNYDKALRYYKDALIVMRELNEKGNIAKCLNNIGVIYLKKDEYEKAKTAYQEGLEIANGISDNYITALCYNNLGELYLRKKEYALALGYYKKALILKKEIKHFFGICHSNIGVTTVYIETKQFSQAYKYDKDALLIAKSNNFLREESEIYNLLYKINKEKQQYKKALLNLEMHKKLSDSLLNKKSIQKITQLEYDYKYQTQLKLASVREQQLTKRVNLSSKNLKKTKQNFLIFIIFFLLIIILLGGVIFYLKLRNIKGATQNIVIEQKLLRSQMTSHFIFNSLSVLQGMILSKEDEKSVTYLSKFSKLLRIILENSRDKIVSLNEEMKAIENYLILQNLGTISPFNYSLNIAENIDAKSFKIPPMLMQPFVENAIEHAFWNQQENKKIIINVMLIDQKLICTILDNGIGIDAHQKINKKRNKHSLATTITSERLEMLSKDFKMKGNISILDRNISKEKGT